MACVPCRRLVAPLAVCVLAASGFAQSPFHDRPAVSYSGGTNLTWGMAPLTDFGPRVVAFDPTGVRAVRQVPAAGVHPRILCTPDDRDDIRRRLQETRCGQEAWKNLLCWTEAMKGRYDDAADYAQPYEWNGSHGGLKSRVPLFRLNAPRDKSYNRSQPAAELYTRLAQGTATNFPDYYWGVFALEAFRCWIEDDAAAAKPLAGAVVTAMKLEQAKRAAKAKPGPPDQPVGGLQLAFAYDFLFPWLDAAQRKAIHAELADATWSHDNYGTFNEACSSRSNWATFSYWLFQVLAIEGEPGFNDLKVRGMYRGWQNLLTYGWFQSGATFEGEAKSQLGMDGVLVFAMRAKDYGFENLAGHPYLRAYATNFLPKSVIPTFDGFITYDLLGGAHGRPMAPDSLGLKYLFPQDRTIDWVYRSAVGANYEHVPDRCDGYRNDLLFFLLFATDFDPANSDPAQLGTGPTFFCGERALLMTRSGWDTNALMLNLHVRQANGGHAFADRNAIMLAGAGRVWSPPTYASFRTRENSVVCIDDRTQDLDAPGRMVDFVDQPLATFAVGDAKHAWAWNWQTLGRTPPYLLDDVRAGRVEIPPGWQKVEHAINDFSFLKLPFAYLNRPLFEQAHWIAPAGSLSPVVREPNLNVRRAFRTAGVVRGSHPYALVVDDIQVDDQSHRYDWILTLERDIQLAGVTRHDGQLDVLLRGTNSDARLLVRVLAADGLGEPVVDDIPNSTDAKKYGTIHRLVIPALATAPGFKVLLYPHRPGALLPKTSVEDRGTAVSVSFENQQDRVAFKPSKSGKTHISIERNTSGQRATLIAVDREIEPLRDEALEWEAARIRKIREDLAGFDPASVAGRVTVPPLTGVATTNGKVGAAWVFAGAKEGVMLPLDLRAVASNGFTLAFWCVSTGGDGTLIANNGNRGFSLGFEHGRYLRTDGLAQHRWKGNVPLDIARWHHLAVVAGHGALSMYLDGRLLKSDPSATPTRLVEKTVLGSGFTGLIDGLLMFERPLTAAEIERLHGYDAFVRPAKP